MEQTCECGCGRVFVATNTGSPRRFFERACQRRAKQRRYIRNPVHREVRRAGSKRYHARHREKISAKYKAYYAARLDAERARHRKKARMPYTKSRALLRTYGIDLDEYNRLLEAQGGRCAICRTPDPGPKRSNAELKPSFAVDHDHQTDQVRGLLCEKCNRGLGQFNDNPEHLEAAAA